jgi:ribosomal protein S1
MNRKHLTKREVSAQTSSSDSRTRLVELLRKHNVSLPKLTGRHVEATVLRVQAKTILVDTGFYGVSEVNRAEVNLAHLLAPSGSDKSEIIRSRATITDLRPGDKVGVRIQATFTPFGDMQLAGVGNQSQESVSQNILWRDLEACMYQGRPVEGRVLNACPGGYAVGVGGFVGLLPYGSFKKSPHMVKAVGVLQKFLVTHVNEERKQLRLAAF